LTGATRKNLSFIVVVLFLFLFRLAFGLCSEFWFEDERQVYLIGLKHFTTHAWPYFGPDVTNQIQIPGALQGLLISIPLFILRIPEAPFILLNLLSFSSLYLMAWYCTKRLPEVPGWFIWIWLMTAPWTLNFSTHVVNPSYVLPGAILFFIGFLETCPYTSKQLISNRLANFMMGLSLFWVMQLHLSWTILVPYVCASFFFQLKSSREDFIRSFGWFAVGALLTGSLLFPTLLKFGLQEGLGGTGTAAVMNIGNVSKVLNPVEGILARFLSFASYELPRFIGDNSARRWEFVKQHLWLSPIILFLVIVGIVQPIAMVVLWFSKKSHVDWRAIRYLTLSTVLLLCVSFIFSMKAPASHTFYLTLPISMIYSFYCWSSLLTKPRWQKFALLVLVCGIAFHIVLAVEHFKSISLYVDRGIPASAIEKRDYRILSERRAGARY
jgi:hypothetical protein